ncbi:unnamed protein product [Moneuplotes crassus]|uniref:Uncharacterized protein n=1 Tax=Euplotes crassus TaxID=5936 RepID=A0AAD2D427_EUPCR|nr:unnamed protein product [Moneuplotes crassus]
MEAQEIICYTEGCICKPIRRKPDQDERECYCIWHCDLKIETTECRKSRYDKIDLFAITDEDMQFIEIAQKIFEQVFAQKEESEKDQFNRRLYSFLNGYLKKTFKSLLMKCREWIDFHLECEDEVCSIMGHEYEKLLMSGVEKIYCKERYCDPKILFELLSVSNDNIGKFYFGENLISTEETKENIHLSTQEEIRSCIFKSYYLIECVYKKKEPFLNFNLSKGTIHIIHAEKDRDMPFSNSKFSIKKANEHENNYLADIDISIRNADVCEIDFFKIFDFTEIKAILESYCRYLKINSNSILRYVSEEIKVNQLKSACSITKENQGTYNCCKYRSFQLPTLCKMSYKTLLLSSCTRNSSLTQA